jgi:hypothetical protein
MIQETLHFKPQPKLKAGTAMYLVHQFLKLRPGLYFTSWEISKGIFEDTQISMTDESASRYARWLRKSGQVSSRKRANDNGKPYSEFTYLLKQGGDTNDEAESKEAGGTFRDAAENGFGESRGGGAG